MGKNDKSNNKVLYVVIVMLLLLVVGLTSYIVYTKFIGDSEKQQTEEKNKKSTELSADEKQEISSKLSNILFHGTLNYDGRYEGKDDEEISAYSFNSSILNDLKVSDSDKELIALQVAPSYDLSVMEIHNENIKKVCENGGYSSLKQKSEMEVNAVFKEYFGGDWPNVDTEKIGYCPGYYYDSVNKVYYQHSACGGATPVTIILHKENYQYDGEQATVDLYIALTRPASDDFSSYYILKDVKTTGEFDKNSAVETISQGTKYAINDSNKDKFNSYKFTFKKSDKGNFYFESLKKN